MFSIIIEDVIYYWYPSFAADYMELHWWKDTFFDMIEETCSGLTQSSATVSEQLYWLEFTQ